MLNQLNYLPPIVNFIFDISPILIFGMLIFGIFVVGIFMVGIFMVGTLILPSLPN